MKLGSEENKAHCLLAIKIYKALNKRMKDINERMAWVLFERLRIQTASFGDEVLGSIHNQYYFDLN